MQKWQLSGTIYSFSEFVGWSYSRDFFQIKANMTDASPSWKQSASARSAVHMVLHRSEKMKGLWLFLFSLQLLGMDLSQIMLEGIFLTPIYRAVIGVIVFVDRGGLRTWHTKMCSCENKGISIKINPFRGLFSRCPYKSTNEALVLCFLFISESQCHRIHEILKNVFNSWSNISLFHN